MASKLYKNVFKTWYAPLDKTGTLNALENVMSNLPILYENTTVFPRKNQVFRIFRDVDYNNCKVILLGMDPYHNVYQGYPSACGRAFATENGYKNPSLRSLFTELQTDIGYDKRKKLDYSLQQWVDQGILLLNTSLTVEKGSPGSHVKLWQAWTKRFVSNVSKMRPDVVWILLGKKAQRWEEYINDQTMIIKASHPSPLARGAFFGSKIFSKTNTILVRKKRKPITWI